MGKKKLLNHCRKRINAKPKEVVIVEKKINRKKLQVINHVKDLNSYQNQIQVPLNRHLRLIEVVNQILLLDLPYLQMKLMDMSQWKMEQKLMLRQVIFRNCHMQIQTIQNRALKIDFPDFIGTSQKVLESVTRAEVPVMNQLDGKITILPETR